MTIAQLVFDVLVFAVLVFASVSDIKTRIVPPVYQYALAGLSVAHLIFLFAFKKDSTAAVSCILTGLLVFAIYIVMFLIFKSGIGGADTKVTSLMASYLGLYQTICFVVSHCIVALGYTVYMKKAKNQIIKSVPLMPFLAAGYVITKVIWWVMALV